MVYWTVLAAGTPSFFPDWIQAVTWAIGGTGGVLLIAWAKHVEVLNTRIAAKDEDIKRLEVKNTEFEKQLKEANSVQTSSHESTIEPIGAVLVSDNNEDTQKLLPSSLSISPRRENGTKNKARKIATQIEMLIDDAMVSNGYSVQAKLLGFALLNIDIFLLKFSDDEISRQAITITEEALKRYKLEIRNDALTTRDELTNLSKKASLERERYSSPESLPDLKAISENLRSLADDAPD
jgi:hypothetical protein